MAQAVEPLPSRQEDPELKPLLPQKENKYDPD
jgi:hypothetical protein